MDSTRLRADLAALTVAGRRCVAALLAETFGSRDASTERLGRALWDLAADQPYAARAVRDEIAEHPGLLPVLRSLAAAALAEDQDTAALAALVATWGPEMGTLAARLTSAVLAAEMQGLDLEPAALRAAADARPR